MEIMQTVRLIWQRGTYRERACTVKLGDGFTHISLKDMNRRVNWLDFAGACTEPGTQRQSGETHGQEYWCRSIIHYTSYLRTNDCTNNGYVTDMLEHNTMINIDTDVHMISYNTQT